MRTLYTAALFALAMLASLGVSPLLSATAHADTATTRPVETHFFQPKFGDFQAELQAAREQGKQGVFLFFELDDCPFCARMKANILNQADVQDAFRAFALSFPIDVAGDLAMTDFAGRETTEKAFALEHRARATPTMIFFDLSGKPVARYTGAFKDKAEFLRFGRYLAEGAYKKQPFAAYKTQP